MKALHTIATRLTALTLSYSSLAAEPAVLDNQLAADETPVQLAILLDTSNSMDGLIEQAKSQLWKIVNEFNEAKQGDKKPVVQVALYEYGNQRLSVGSNYIRQILPFTRDLDEVSDKLFQLTTNGGEEYCGAVIYDALDRLNWDLKQNVYKAIFIAGNEPFTQGNVSVTKACKAAAAKDIIVNTIHCGDRKTGTNEGWDNGAALAGGRFLNIDQDKEIVHVAAPQDEEISRISIELNNTYVAYGAKGKEKAANQLKQDENAKTKKSAGSELQRALTKSSANYKNSYWDLVDACKKDGLKLEAVEAAELPDAMKTMNAEERKAYIDSKATERTNLQEQIQKLNAERKKFLAGKNQESAAKDTLDKAIASAVKGQAAKKKIQFK